MDTNQEQHQTSSTQPLLLQASGLERRTSERVLLEDVSVEIHGGDRIAVVGPTGSGKTLMLRALALLDPVTAGEVCWRGKALRGDEIPKFRSRVIYVHQRPALIEGTVEDNLRQPFSLRVYRGQQFRRARIVDLLESLGRRESFLSQKQRDLSGGEAQLVALLRAVQLEPDIVLLDEPTAALDTEARGMVETLAGNWLDERPIARATVWVTHDQEQARRVSTRVLAIREGRLSGDLNGRIR